MQIIKTKGRMTRFIPDKTDSVPRQRNGKSFPGGKHLRKAQERLAARRQGCDAIRQNLGRNGTKSVPESSYRMPGSMTK